MRLNITWNATDRANANMAIKARYTIEENKNNRWRGYDRNYTIICKYYGHEWNYMTIGNGWGCLEYIDKAGNGWFLTLHNITPDGVDIISVATFNANNRHMQKEYRAERYLKKYERVAFMIYALVNCGYIDTVTKVA